MVKLHHNVRGPTMFKLLIASLTVWLVCGPCSADNFKPIIKESDCGGDDEWPVWTLPTPVNETWLTTMKERIGNAFYRTGPPPDGLGSRKLTLYVKYPIVELRVDATEDGAIFSP
jgi:hypothetical protein